MSDSIGRTFYALGFQISPIILCNGIAGQIGGLLPIVALTEGANLIGGVLQGDVPDSLDQYFAHFYPMPNSTLIDFQVGEYPFANLTIAANALIAMPLKVSVKMSTPVNQTGGHALKFITFLALQATLQQHSLSGGTYTIATPAYLYTNCLLTNLRDVSSPDGKIPQNTWMFDFVQPLITQQQAQSAQNSLMSRINSATPINGQPTWSGPASVASDPSASAPGFGGGANLTGTSAGSWAPATPIPVTQETLSPPGGIGAATGVSGNVL